MVNHSHLGLLRLGAAIGVLAVSIVPASRAGAEPNLSVAAAGDVVGHVQDTKITQNNDGVRCNGAPTCSPDGKWRSTVVQLRVDAAPGTHLVNVKVTNDGGSGRGFDQFCDIPGSLAVSPSTATATVRCWSGPVTWHLNGDVATN